MVYFMCPKCGGELDGVIKPGILVADRKEYYKCPNPYCTFEQGVKIEPRTIDITKTAQSQIIK